LQDVPKIAQLVEARIHQWFDERCVEPRVQQIVLPSLWPRKKNTRGPEDPPSDEEEEGEEATTGDGAAEEKPEDISADGSLEARMAAEGRILREADEKSTNDGSATMNEGMRKRQPLHRAMGSMQNLKIPGGFS
jgi:maintenance of mitochondrial morphology protein 1